MPVGNDHKKAGRTGRLEIENQFYAAAISDSAGRLSIPGIFSCVCVCVCVYERPTSLLCRFVTPIVTPVVKTRSLARAEPAVVYSPERRWRERELECKSDKMNSTKFSGRSPKSADGRIMNVAPPLSRAFIIRPGDRYPRI